MLPVLISNTEKVTWCRLQPWNLINSSVAASPGCDDKVSVLAGDGNSADTMNSADEW
jgi:hypothetical protein